jgi:hypothetical protein
MWNGMWGFKHVANGQHAQRQRITVELPVRMTGLPLERPADWLGIQEIDRLHRGRANGKGSIIEWSQALAALKISLSIGYQGQASPKIPGARYPVWRQVLIWMAKPEGGENASNAVRTGTRPRFTIRHLADQCKTAQAHEGAGRKWPATNGIGKHQACRIVIEVGEGRELARGYAEGALAGSPRAPPLMYRTRPRGRELGSSDLPAGGVESPLIQYAPFVFPYSLVCHRGAGTALVTKLTEVIATAAYFGSAICSDSSLLM